MRWWRDSAPASPTVVPASTAPCRWMAPVRARIASSNVVLPLWNGPASATHRGPLGLMPPFCPIRISLIGYSWLVPAPSVAQAGGWRPPWRKRADRAQRWLGRVPPGFSADRRVPGAAPIPRPRPHPRGLIPPGPPAPPPPRERHGPLAP